MKRILVVYGGHTGGRTAAMTAAISQGVMSSEELVELRCLPALTAGADDLLWAQGLLIGTPEHFGYMSGAVKDFFDRTFYPVEGKVDALPYALYVTAGNDGTGAVASVERIALGYRWKCIAAPLVVRGNPTAQDLQRCQELGLMMATGLVTGIF
jgi:multimeric flavodoxin WrbA